VYDGSWVIGFMRKCYSHKLLLFASLSIFLALSPNGTKITISVFISVSSTPWMSYQTKVDDEEQAHQNREKQIKWLEIRLER